MVEIGYLAVLVEITTEAGIRLEISCAACGTGGSNPSLSAISRLSSWSESKQEIKTEGPEKMTRDEIQERVCEIVLEQLIQSGSEKVLSIHDIKPNSAFMEDLGADSLDVVEIVTSVEETFDLLIPDEVLEGIRTVSDAVDYLASKA